ncbi:MAG TPA: MetQ/NlpA family ABC transporter substrate-binding protein [Devosia sp.]|nr:MetQ/NlpA family ABC transporter substrate-binding protein [Devosia sp.]
MAFAQAGGWPAAPAAGEKGSAENPIKLGSNWTVGFLPAYSMAEVAKPHGWSIEVIDFASSSQRATALAQGSLDAAMLGWGATLKLAVEGFPAIVVANSFSDGYAMIARPEAKIASVNDLKGKKVAITIGSMNEIHLLSQLANAGLAKEEVEIVQMNLADMSLALARGDIDVMVSDEPASSTALTAGYGVLVKYPNDTNMGGINANVTTTKDFTEKSAAAVQVLVTALVEATDTLNSDPQAVLGKAKEIFKKEDNVVQMALENITMGYDINLEQVAALAEWQLNLGQIKAAPDLSGLVTTKYVDAAK